MNKKVKLLNGVFFVSASSQLGIRVPNIPFCYPGTRGIEKNKQVAAALPDNLRACVVDRRNELNGGCCGMGTALIFGSLNLPRFQAALQ